MTRGHVRRWSAGALAAAAGAGLLAAAPPTPAAAAPAGGDDLVPGRPWWTDEPLAPSPLGSGAGAAPSDGLSRLQAVGGEFELCFDPDVPPDVRAVFEAAAAVWSETLVVRVPVTVDVRVDDLGSPLVLGGAMAGVQAKNQPGLPRRDTYYPVALANQLAGRDLVPGGCYRASGGALSPADVIVVMNSRLIGSSFWYLGLEGSTGGRTDMLTTAIHEIGHGLGFDTSAAVNPFSGTGSFTYGSQGGAGGLPTVFDRAALSAAAGRPIGDLPQPSALLAVALQGGDLRFEGANARAQHCSGLPLYAPPSWEPGSSVSHLDPDAFPATGPDALMAPFLEPGRSFRVTALTTAILADLGWTTAPLPASTCPSPATYCPPRGDLTDQVCRIYVASFLRAPDEAGLGYWRRVRASGVPVAGLASSFAASDEFAARYGRLGDGEFVTLLYDNVLGRAPDPAGHDHWTRLLAAGTPRGEVLVEFSESPEFVARTGTRPPVASSAASVGRLYRAFFQRPPDQPGLAHWSDAVRRGTPLPTVAAQFADSAEFERRYGSLGDRAFVELVYRNVLGRPGEPAGVEYWTGQLAAGVARGRVVVGFSESTEFRLATDTLP